ncbi:hypothetical protein ACVPOW_00380 [Staphylococcus aureus]
MMMNFYSIERSMEIAKERRWYQYQDFEKSAIMLMANISSSIQLKNLNLNSKKYVNYSMVWLFLLLRIGRNYNKMLNNMVITAYRLAIAPTQSISYVQNATSSVMPIS